MNYRGIWAIFKFEMMRAFRTIGQSIASPIISTILYFIVFGSAIGTHVKDIDGVPYGAFIVPGLIMLTILGQSIANASLAFISHALLVRSMKFYQRHFHLLRLL